MTEELGRLLSAALETPGLFPRWVGAPPATLLDIPAADLAELARVVADGRRLASVPPRAWHPALLHVWRAGALYLCDEAAEIDDDAQIRARRVIVRASQVGAFARIAGDLVLLERAVVEAMGSLEGPLVAVDCRIGAQATLGPMAHVTGSALDVFVKAQRGVRIDRSEIGSHTSIEGQRHPEQIPLGAQRRTGGVRIGPEAWVGAHVSVGPGVSIARGAVVAPFTSVRQPVPEHVLVAGTPARVLPIDHHLRGLSAADAREEGRTRGASALALPAYGARHAAWRAQNLLEIDYAEHAALRGRASEQFLAFQAGALETALTALFPGHRAEVRFAAGETVRFQARFDPPVPRAAAEAFASPDAPPLPPFVAAAREPRPAAGERSTTALIQELLRALLPKGVVIDLDAPFYALGLDSLSAADLAGRIQDELDIEAPDLRAHNTVRLLAEEIDRCLRR